MGSGVWGLILVFGFDVQGLGLRSPDEGFTPDSPVENAEEFRPKLAPFPQSVTTSTELRRPSSPVATPTELRPPGWLGLIVKREASSKKTSARTTLAWFWCVGVWIFVLVLIVECWVFGSWFSIWGFEFLVFGFWFLVFDSGFWASEFWFWVLGFGFWVLGFGFGCGV